MKIRFLAECWKYAADKSRSQLGLIIFAGPCQVEFSRRWKDLFLFVEPKHNIEYSSVNMYNLEKVQGIFEDEWEDELVRSHMYSSHRATKQGKYQ